MVGAIRDAEDAAASGHVGHLPAAASSRTIGNHSGTTLGHVKHACDGTGCSRWGVALGLVYHFAREGEESKAAAARDERLSRLALTSAYDLKIVPESVPVTPFYIIHMGSGSTSDGIYAMNRPNGGGVWLECVIKNVGDTRLEEITLSYRGHFIGKTGRGSIENFPISGLSPGDRYTFYIVNADSSTRLEVQLPRTASARIYNETEKVEVQIRRAPESGIIGSIAEIGGGAWKPK
jgi:hypothetical protein